MSVSERERERERERCSVCVIGVAFLYRDIVFRLLSGCYFIFGQLFYWQV